MSYEGRDVVLCVNGHKHEYNSFDSPLDALFPYGEGVNPAAWKCSVCDADYSAHYSIDETNGLDEDGKYPGEITLEVIEAAKYETCNLGHQHLIQPRRYK